MPELTITETVEIGDREITVARFGAGPIQIVLLHDGLGSISQWRSVPTKLAESTDVGVLAYDRAGHGTSKPSISAKADWLHQEAEVLTQLVTRFQIVNPLIVGHSDGGSIALIYAAKQRNCAGVLTLAAHSFVEEVCLSKINEMRATPGPIVIGMARHHESPQQLFNSWSGVWTSAEFRSWDIRPMLGSIECPALIVQGDADAYATDAQLTETAEAIGPNATAMRVAGVGHVIHHEVPDHVVEIAETFFRSLR